MSKPLPNGLDTQPWFVQFWPWFLILLPASVVVAAIATLVIAHTGADDLVAEQYYRDGLAINRKLEEEQRAIELNIRAQFTLTNLEIQVKLNASQPTETLILKLFHPHEADRDRVLQLTAMGDNTFGTSMAEPLSGRWHWALQPAQGHEWRISGTVENHVFSES